MNQTRLEAWLRRAPSDFTGLALIYISTDETEEVVNTWPRAELPESEEVLCSSILSICQDYSNDARHTCRFRLQYEKDGRQLKATGIISRALDADDPLNVDTEGRSASSQMVRMNEVQLRLLVAGYQNVINGHKGVIEQVQAANTNLREENKALRELFIAKLKLDDDAEATETQIKQQAALDKFFQLCEKYGPAALAKWTGINISGTSPAQGGNGNGA